MGGGDLNTKKSWHPNTIKNQERVWKAEQAAAEEKKRIIELQRERDQERDQAQLKDMVQRNFGSNTVSNDNRLRWMYDKPDKQAQQEDYLLGKAIGKTEDADNKQNTITAVSRRVVGSSMNSTGDDSQVDLARKLREDPLLLVKERERAARAALLNNPLQRKKLADLLRIEQSQKQGKSKVKSKKKGKSLDDVLAAKLNALGGEKGIDLTQLLNTSDSSDSSSSAGNNAKKKKKTRKHKKKKSKKSKKKKVSSDSDSNLSASDSTTSNKKKSSKSKKNVIPKKLQLNEETTPIIRKRRSEDHSYSDSEAKKRRDQDYERHDSEHFDRNRNQNSFTQHDNNKFKSSDISSYQNVTRKYYNQHVSRRCKNDYEEHDKQKFNEDSGRDRTSENKYTKERLSAKDRKEYTNSDSDGEARRLRKSRDYRRNRSESEDNKHVSKNRSSPRRYDINHRGKVSTRVSRRNSANSHSDESVPNDRDRQLRKDSFKGIKREFSPEKRNGRRKSPRAGQEDYRSKRTGLSAEEKAARLAEMAAAGAERENERGARVARQRADDAAAARATTGPRRAPAQPLPQSLESRIHSNRHYIQRGPRHMDEHFAKR